LAARDGLRARLADLDDVRVLRALVVRLVFATLVLLTAGLEAWLRFRQA
jgi:hypothetical protein